MQLRIGWWRRAASLVAASLVAAIMLGGCAALALHPGGNELVLDNGQHTQTTDALVAAFERATGIHVSIRSDDEDVLAEQIVNEGAGAQPDLVYTENSPALEFLQQRHLLARVEASTLRQVPSRFDSPAADWVGVSARVSVLVYNTRLVPAAYIPTSILALASPSWRGKLAIAPQETDFQPIVAAVAHALGERGALRWLDGIRRNGEAHEYQDNEAVTAAVNSGQASIGVVDQYYWYRLRSEVGAGSMHSAIAFFAPRDPGYVVDVSGAAILRTTHDMRAAQEFLAFLVSAKGQEIIARSDSFEYPLRRGIRAAAALRPFDDLHPYPIDLAALGNGAEAISLMRRAGLLP
jgi:iron(III) transport system substrate-binding protein